MGSRMLPLRGPSPGVGAGGRQMGSNVVGWGENSPNCQLHSHDTPTPDPTRVWQPLLRSHTVPCAGKGKRVKTLVWTLPCPLQVLGAALKGLEVRALKELEVRLCSSPEQRCFPTPENIWASSARCLCEDRNTQHQALEGARLSDEGEDREGREKGEGHGQKSG